MKAALVIMDVQNALVEGNPYNKDQFLQTLKGLLSEARARQLQVIHVQHNGPAGSFLEPGSPGWLIEDTVRPRPGEPVVRKEYNSAFKNTDLNRILSDLNVDTIILTGMQTEYCIDTTCRVAFEKGYNVVIPEGSNTTFSSDLLDAEIIILHHNRFLFDNRFARLLAPPEVIEQFFPPASEI